LPAEAIGDLRDHLQRFGRYFGHRTRTRASSAYGLSYVSGWWRMQGGRTIAEVAGEGAVAEQNLQHFMSNSPWSDRALIAHRQQALVERPALEGGWCLWMKVRMKRVGPMARGSGGSPTDGWGKLMGRKSGYSGPTPRTNTGRWGMGACLSRKRV